MYKIIILLLPCLLVIGCTKDDSLSDYDKQVESFKYSNANQSGVHITGRVWDDVDGDGIQDAGEPNIEGAEVLFVNATHGWIIGRVKTDKDGIYRMYASVEINYRLRVILPSNGYEEYILTESNTVGIEALDSDYKNDNGKFVSEIYKSDQDNDLDCGVYQGGVIGDQIWFEEDLGSGLPDIQDNSDLPLAEVEVKLYSIDLLSGNEILFGATKSDEFGKYSFTKLPKGIYFIEVDVPQGAAYPPPLRFVIANVGADDKNDSDIVTLRNNSDSGVTRFIELEASEENLNIDIGFKNSHTHPPLTYTLSRGRIFEDANENGVRDSNENGIEGVELELIYRDTDEVVSSAVSDANGKYSFSIRNWYPNNNRDHFIKVILPNDYKLTKKDQGSDDDADSDFWPLTASTPYMDLIEVANGGSIDAGLIKK